MQRAAGFISIVAACGVIAAPLRADPVEDFYKGKQVRVVIGFGAGGGYDLSARLVTKHMGRFIPGHPIMVPQNMPGAGAAVAAQFLMQGAPRDGTVLATLGQNIPFDQVMDPRRSETYDASKMLWVGNANEENNVIEIWRESGVTSIEDAFKREIVLGATAADGADALYPQVLNNVLGTKFKIIGGFPGGADQNLAMERRETDGRGSNTMSSLDVAAICDREQGRHHPADGRREGRETARCSADDRSRTFTGRAQRVRAHQRGGAHRSSDPDHAGRAGGPVEGAARCVRCDDERSGVSGGGREGSD